MKLSLLIVSLFMTLATLVYCAPSSYRVQMSGVT